MNNKLAKFFADVDNIKSLSYYHYDDIEALNNPDNKILSGLTDNSNNYDLLKYISKITIDPLIIDNILSNKSDTFSYYIKYNNDITQLFDNIDVLMYCVMVIINPLCINKACKYFTPDDFVDFIKFITKYIPRGIYYETLIKNIPKDLQIYEIYVYILNINKNYIKLIDNANITNEYFINFNKFSNIYDVHEIYELFKHNVINEDSVGIYLNITENKDKYLTNSLLNKILLINENNKDLCKLMLRYYFIINPTFVIKRLDFIETINKIFNTKLSSPTHVFYYLYV